MEKVDWENEMCNRKKAYQEGINRNAENSNGEDERFKDPKYTESRRLWDDYLARRITADQMQQDCRRLNGEDIEPQGLGEVKDIFKAEEI